MTPGCLQIAWARFHWNARDSTVACRVHEYFDGTVELRYYGRPLPFTVFEEQRQDSQGDVVSNERLGAVLATIQADQRKRHEEALASPLVRNRRKERIRTVFELADAPGAAP